MNRLFIPTPGNNFEKINQTSLFVKGADYLLVSFYVYDERLDIEEDNAFFYISRIDVGSAEIKHEELSYTKAASFCDEFSNFEKCEYVYDKINQNLYYVIVSSNRKEDFLKYIIQPYSINEKRLLGKFELPNTSIAKYYKENPLINNRDYYLFPLNLCVNNNGTLSVLGEDFSLNKVIKWNDEIIPNSILKDIGITNISINGNENYGFVVPFNNHIDHIDKSLFYYNNKKGHKPESSTTMVYGIEGTLLNHIDLVAGKNFSYVFFNSTLIDFEKKSNTKNTKPVYCKIDQTGKYTSGYIFDKSDDPKIKNFCHFYGAAFDYENSKYAVIKTETVNKKKMARIIWLNLE